jgi:peptide/nickel transport system ATP-binding protein
VSEIVPPAARPPAEAAQQVVTDERQIVLTVRSLRVELESTGADIDDEVEFTIHNGEVLGLVGESASGKTTAATALLVHERRGAVVSKGEIILMGQDIRKLDPQELRKVRGCKVSYVPQDPSMSLNPALRIGVQLLEVLEVHSFGASDEERRVRVREMMAEVRLPGDDAFLRRYPHQLSGGQQQRVAIAMAFACRPALIVLDEPTTGLDVTTQAHVLRTVHDLTRTYGVAALYVTHDLAVVANLADRIAVMYAGRLVEIGPKETLFRGASHPYTRRLIASVPDLAGKYALRGIPGRAPLPGRRPQGCSFADRCEFSQDRCREEFPPYEGPSADHRVRCWRWREVGAKSTAEGMSLRAPIVLPAGDVEPVVRVRDVRASYGTNEVLHGIDMDVRAGRCLALVGESGSGKTTIARCIAGIHPGRIEGEILLNGRPLARESKRRPTSDRQAIQYIFQSPYASLNPRRSIAQILAPPLQTFFRLSRRESDARMAEALEMVSLDASLLNVYPDQLSGGERQRVAIARALVAKPCVLICDEVTSSLDVSVQASIVELLVQLVRDTGVAMLFVTHHLPLVRSLAQEVLVMNQGEIVERGLVDEVLADPQADYTKNLLADTPDVIRATA